MNVLYFSSIFLFVKCLLNFLLQRFYSTKFQTWTCPLFPSLYSFVRFGGAKLHILFSATKYFFSILRKKIPLSASCLLSSYNLLKKREGKDTETFRICKMFEAKKLFLWNFVGVLLTKDQQVKIHNSISFILRKTYNSSALLHARD